MYNVPADQEVRDLRRFIPRLILGIILALSVELAFGIASKCYGQIVFAVLTW